MNIKTTYLLGIVSIFPIFLSQSVQAASISEGSASPSTGPAVCKPGFSPPQCLAQPFDTTNDIAYQGGSALPAVASDTIPGFPAIHQAAFANDGNYGNGSSWIANNLPNSWLKIDLGSTQTINSLTFGRDRLGGFDDRDPGQFIIEVAISDNVYGNGDSSNDSNEYTEIIDSSLLGFSGTIIRDQTIQADFDPVVARYVKLTFVDPSTAIDEVEIASVPEPLTILGTFTVAGLLPLLKKQK